MSMVCLRRLTGGTYFVKVKEDYEVWKILHMIVPFLEIHDIAYEAGIKIIPKKKKCKKSRRLS